MWTLPEFDGIEKPLPSPEELGEEENLDGLSGEQLETFRQRAVPEPAAALREAAELTNDARLDVPSIVVCTGFTSEQYKEAIKGLSGVEPERALRRGLALLSCASAALRIRPPRR